MSVLIKGLKLPKDDAIKVVIRGDDGIASVYLDDGKADYYKVIELPDHGDLIDRNMLIGGFADWYIQESPMYLGDDKVVAETIGEAMKAIEAAPVVIPAERSEG